MRWLLLLVLGSLVAAAPPEREAVIGNRGREPINELYLSPHDVDQWGEDRLGDDTLDPGRQLRLRLGRSRSCLWDARAVYGDASHEELRGLDLCRNRSILFDGSGAVGGSPMGPARQLTISNEAGRPIQQVLISPSDANDWGDDRLDTSLSTGAQAVLSYSGPCAADVRVVFDNRSAEERRGLDLCAASALAIRPGWTTADTLPSAAAAPQAITLTITNHSGHLVTELRVFAEDTAERGRNLLPSDALADGERTSLPFTRNGCRYAAHVGFGGRAPDQDIGGLDLCRSAEIALTPRL